MTHTLKLLAEKYSQVVLNEWESDNPDHPVSKRPDTHNPKGDGPRLARNTLHAKSGKIVPKDTPLSDWEELDKGDIEEENHDETDMSNPEERTEVHIARELLSATNMKIKIDLYNKEVKVIKEIEEGYLSEVKSKGGYVYDYEEYLIVDMREEG